MYILKNAYLSIIRNKGRNILIGIIILVISCASAVTLAIKTSASKIINSYEEKNEITASIEVNRDNVMKNFDPSKENRDSSKKEMIEEFNNLESLSISDIKNYAIIIKTSSKKRKSSYVIYAFYFCNFSFLKGGFITKENKTK